MKKLTAVLMALILALAIGCSACADSVDELMAQQDIALSGIDRGAAQYRCHRVLIRHYLFGPKRALNLGRPQEGKHPDDKLSRLVTESDALHFPLESIAHIYAGAAYQGREIRNARSRIVIAADDEHVFAGAYQTGHERIEQLHGFCLGRRTLVYVAGYEHRVRALSFGSENYLIEDGFLIVEERHVVELLSEMEICGVDEFHFGACFPFRAEMRKREILFICSIILSMEPESCL